MKYLFPILIFLSTINFCKAQLCGPSITKFYDFQIINDSLLFVIFDKNCSLHEPYGYIYNYQCKVINIKSNSTRDLLYTNRYGIKDIEIHFPTNQEGIFHISSQILTDNSILIYGFHESNDSTFFFSPFQIKNYNNEVWHLEGEKVLKKKITDAKNLLELKNEINQFLSSFIVPPFQFRNEEIEFESKNDSLFWNEKHQIEWNSNNQITDRYVNFSDLKDTITIEKKDPILPWKFKFPGRIKIPDKYCWGEQSPRFGDPYWRYLKIIKLINRDENFYFLTHEYGDNCPYGMDILPKIYKLNSKGKVIWKLDF